MCMGERAFQTRIIEGNIGNLVKNNCIMCLKIKRTYATLLLRCCERSDRQTARQINKE